MHWDELLTFIFLMLAHSFPKVRRYVAEQLYVAILDNDGIVKDDAKYEDASSLLLEVPWDAELESTPDYEEGVRKKRNELADLFEVSLSEKARAKKEKKGGGVKKQTDELASYMSLVKETGR